MLTVTIQAIEGVIFFSLAYLKQKDYVTILYIQLIVNRLIILSPQNSNKHVMRSKFTDHMRGTVTLLSDIELNFISVVGTWP